MHLPIQIKMTVSFYQNIFQLRINVTQTHLYKNRVLQFAVTNYTDFNFNV